ncbi:MAG: DHA2 family efflux MFS transporter permease subunit [Candidatus Methanomethylophilaceae archaeon]
MTGLAFAMLIACFDSTIVGTCGPVIAADINGLGSYSWMIAAYMLCETLMIPIAGKLSDLFGRKPLFLMGLGLFTSGSVAAGLSTDMNMLIVCRAIQGIGGGTLVPVTTATVADLYPPEERGKMQGIMSAVFSIGSGIGPILGGYITEFIGWRWVFYINVPLAAIAFTLTIWKFPTPITSSKPSIDYIGISILTAFLLDVMLLIEGIGTKFGWLSVQSVAMSVAAIVLLTAFIAREKRAAEPVIAPHLIHNRTVVLSSVFAFLFGIAMMGALVYTSMFAVNVLGLTTLESGTYLIAMVLGMMITAVMSGRTVNRTGYRLWLILGPVTTAAGLFLLSGMTIGTDLRYCAASLFVFGLGLGCMMSVITTAIQNSSVESEIGMTTSTVNVMKAIGYTIGTAVFTFIINNRLSAELMERLPGDVYDSVPHNTEIISWLPSLSPEDAYNALLSFANSVDFSFVCADALMLLLVAIGVVFKAETPEKED